MECFEEQQESEQSNKFWIKVISEYSEGQTCLCYGIPRPFYQMLKQTNYLKGMTILDV